MSAKKSNVIAQLHGLHDGLKGSAPAIASMFSQLTKEL
jgi:hypothetical protein